MPEIDPPRPLGLTIVIRLDKTVLKFCPSYQNPHWRASSIHNPRSKMVTAWARTHEAKLWGRQATTLQSATWINGAGQSAREGTQGNRTAAPAKASRTT